MLTSFIHFHDLQLSTVDLYSYDENELTKTSSISIEHLNDSLPQNSKCFVFLPSQLFGFHYFQNELGLKNDELQANVINAIEDSIVSDISALNFSYDSSLSMATWIDKELLLSINKSFNALSGDFILLPEHLLLGVDKPKILFSSSEFCISFGDGSGFSGEHSSFDSLYASLNDSKFNVNAIQSFKTELNITTPEMFDEKIQTKELTHFHLDFLQSHYAYDIHLFKRELSLEYLKSQMSITSRDLIILSAICVTILIAPFLTNYVLKTSANIYYENTVQIFQQLNPNFNKLVNSKAQIDELSKNVPDEVVGSMSPDEEIQLLTYLERFNDPAFKNIEIDLLQQRISISIEGLTKFKLKIIQEALKQYPLLADDTGLVEQNNAFFGSLIIRYKNE